jgi:hypothetical protein
VLALGIGLALLGSLVLHLDRSALAKDPPKSTTKPAKPGDSAKAAPVTFALDTKDQSVAEMVGLINTKVGEQWQENKVTPSPVCSDHEFIRRASLDIIGRIAKPEEIRAFLAQPAATRRSWLIEELLKSEEYPKNWANVWTTWLLGRAGMFGRDPYKGEMQVWLEDQYAQNKKFNQIVTDLLTASGKNTDNGAVNFILAGLGEMTAGTKAREEGPFEMVPITSRTTRLFLGIQTQCTQCHDHPFDTRLKQQHFWGINAFFRQVKREPMQMMMQGDRFAAIPLTLADDTSANSSGFIFYEKRNGVVLQTRSQFLDGTKLPPEGTNRRAELARLITEHESFPKAYVNRMWGHFLGRGFTSPVDDFNEQNQPSNPELLDEMAKKFKHYGYDPKTVVRWICNSQAYNLSCVANKTNDKPEQEVFFSRMLLKAMSPEQLFESLMVATGAEAAQTKDGKAALRKRWMDTLVSNFGDDEGNEVTFNGTIVQALLMLNGKDINDAITGQKATVAQMLARGGNEGSHISSLYLATLNRPASQKEVSIILSKFPMKVADKDRGGKYHDLLWALVNSNEFILNH